MRAGSSSTAPELAYTSAAPVRFVAMGRARLPRPGTSVARRAGASGVRARRADSSARPASQRQPCSLRLAARRTRSAESGRTSRRQAWDHQGGSAWPQCGSSRRATRTNKFTPLARRERTPVDKVPGCASAHRAPGGRRVRDRPIPARRAKKFSAAQRAGLLRLDRIERRHRRGQGWSLASGRRVWNALANPMSRCPGTSVRPPLRAQPQRRHSDPFRLACGSQISALGSVETSAALDSRCGGDETRISSIVGTWTVVSALLGTLVGTFIGGRYSRFQSGASAVYKRPRLVGVRPGAGAVARGQWNRRPPLGRAEVQSSELRAPRPQKNANQVADAVSWGGCALALGMALTLAAAIAGWWIGSRTQLADAETDDVKVRVR